MTVNATFLSLRISSLVLTLLSCSASEVTEDKAQPQCAEMEKSITALKTTLNHCTAPEDCRAEFAGGTYSCFVFHHRDEDPLPVITKIQAYTESPCWDGDSAACQTPEPEDFACTSQKCVLKE